MGKLTEELLTVQEVAAFLRLNRFTVYRMAVRGELPAFKVTDQWRFSSQEIKTWLGTRRNGKKRNVVRMKADR